MAPKPVTHFTLIHWGTGETVQSGEYADERHAIEAAALMTKDTSLRVPHTPGNPVHRNCFACKVELHKGVPFTALPCSETYWSS